MEDAMNITSTEDQQLTCCDCADDFIWSIGEQEWFAERGLTQRRRCKPCRAAKRLKRDGLPTRSSWP